MEEIQGLIDWVNTFDLDPIVEKIEDLTDGVPFFKIMNEIDPERFQISALPGGTDNWVLKETNLKRLHKLLIQHYENNLGLPSSSLDPINFQEIAKSANEQETVKLAQMVLGCVVQCENNQEYIERITGLSKSSQEVLMMMIQEIMARIQQGNPSHERGRSFSTSSENQATLAELRQVQKERDELESENERFSSRVAELEADLDKSREERSDLRNRIHELEETIAKFDDPDTQDDYLHNEIERLNEELSKSEQKRDEGEKKIQAQQKNIMDLNWKLDQLEKDVEETAKLRQRVKELQEAELKLERTESAIDKYKARLDQFADLQKQFKTLQAEKEELSAKNRELQELSSKNASSKTQLNEFMKAIQELEQKNRELTFLQSKLDYECGEYKTEAEALRAENIRQQEEIRELEQKVQELEISGGGESSEPTGISGQILEKQVAELKVKLAELERNNQLLRGSSSENQSEKEATLNSLLDQAKQSKDQVELELRSEYQKNLQLNNRIKTLEKSLQEYETKQQSSREADIALEQLASSEREARNLQIKLSEQEAALEECQRKLKVSEEALKERSKEAISLRGELQLTSKDKVEMMEAYKIQIAKEMADSIVAKEADLLEKNNELEAIAKRCQELSDELEKVKEELKSSNETNQENLVKISALQSQNLALFEKKLESTEGARSKEADDSLTKKLEIAAQRILTIQEEKSQLQKALKKAKMYIEAQEKKIKEQSVLIQEMSSNVEGSVKNNYPEAIRSLENSVVQKENEIAKLNGKLAEAQEIMKEAREAHKREQRLMVSAWYNLGLQLKQKSVGKKEKASYLGKERQTRQLNRGKP